MQRGEPLPLVWLAPGAVSDPRGLLRFGPLHDIPLTLGPVVAGVPEPVPLVHATGVGGVEHPDHPGYAVPEALDLLRWCGTRGLHAVLAVRGRTSGELADVVGQVRRSLDADALGAVEVDLRGADDQTALKCLARVRETTPRDLLLLARLSALQPDLVAAARGAVAGGAGAVVVCGSVRLGEGRWWSGPSTAAVSRAGVRRLSAAAAERRWPPVPVVAAGGVHDVGSARAALAEGAAAVQLGTALWADPTLLWTVRDALAGDPPPPRPDPTGR
ncbi:nitronate monooxygenase [Ornithinimicrobium flavum]|uniref:nitronate monooxygenase n=1 Tax=Ornithinimicrobium flavum TaxID=1288636 RepID=UPI00106FB76E|nr:nitronate monooxygenase [Ornithinimicrobium flavum]